MYRTFGHRFNILNQKNISIFLNPQNLCPLMLYHCFWCTIKDELERWTGQTSTYFTFLNNLTFPLYKSDILLVLVFAKIQIQSQFFTENISLTLELQTARCEHFTTKKWKVNNLHGLKCSLWCRKGPGPLMPSYCLPSYCLPSLMKCKLIQ